MAVVAVEVEDVIVSVAVPVVDVAVIVVIGQYPQRIGHSVLRPAPSGDPMQSSASIVSHMGSSEIGNPLQNGHVLHITLQVLRTLKTNALSGSLGSILQNGSRFRHDSSSGSPLQALVVVVPVDVSVIEVCVAVVVEVVPMQLLHNTGQLLRVALPISSI